MRYRYILLCVQVVHVSLCYSMEHYFNKFVDIVSQVPQQLMAKIRHEEHLLEKPAISPLPSAAPEILKMVAVKLDGPSMLHFALSCSSINQKLNSEHHWIADWHHNGMRAPLRISKEYVGHNEALITAYSQYTPQQLLHIPTFAEPLKNPLMDFNYCRIQARYYDGALFDTNSYEINPEHSVVDKDTKKILDSMYGPRSMIVNTMMHILCARAQHPECVRHLLEQRADANCCWSLDTESPIQGALNAFTSEKLFVGNAGRCISIINILLDHKADIHYKKADGSNYVHRVSICQDGHLLLPYFIKQGVNLNERNDMGNTPLLALAECTRDILLISEEYFEQSRPGFLESIRLLTEAKADTTMQNNNGKSLFDILPPRLHQEVLLLMKKSEVHNES